MQNQTNSVITKNYYAKQFHPEVKVHIFASMHERDAWVQKHYENLGARHCSVIEARKLSKFQGIIPVSVLAIFS